MILLDTNILIYSNQPESPFHKTVSERLLTLAKENELVVCPQVLYELYVVATKPADKNGLGLSSPQVLQKLKDITDTYTFINDPDNLFFEWHSMMTAFAIAGKSAHNARLVAFMRVHNIEHIYSMNAKHFTRYSNIITII